MFQEKSEAILIRQADFSNSSRVVTFFTQEFGKVAMVAKGAKRLKGPFEAALDLLSVCKIVFLRKHSDALDILTEAKLQLRFKPSPGQLPHLYAGYYLAELLDGLTEPYDPHPLLYLETRTVLERLATPASWMPAVFRFELTLLREMGQLPELERCVLCDGPILGDYPWIGFRVTRGGVACPVCCRDDPEQSRLSPGSYHALRTLAAEADTTWQRLELTSTQSRELRSVLTACISQPLGKRPQMLRYLSFI